MANKAQTPNYNKRYYNAFKLHNLNKHLFIECYSVTILFLAAQEYSIMHLILLTLLPTNPNFDCQNERNMYPSKESKILKTSLWKGTTLFSKLTVVSGL